MKIRQIQFKLIWPQAITLNNLRKFILDNLSREGDVIRWSICEIKVSEEDVNLKTLIIYAVIIK